MYSKMCSSMCVVSIVAFLVVDVRTGALHQETQAHRCHQCSPTNSTACEQHAGWLTATCPGSRPYCATIAQAPDFSSSLGCAAAADEPCSLTNSPRQTLELTCICTGHLCNAPFSNKLRNELLNFSSNSNESALTEAFFKLSNFANVTTDDIYKAITVATAEVEVSTNVSEVTRVMLASRSGFKSEMLPRAEALKQQATAPSDDDEDEGEGSGADDAERAHSPAHTAAAPAPPSSYLPSHDNNAAHLFIPSPLTYIILLASFIF